MKTLRDHTLGNLLCDGWKPVKLIGQRMCGVTMVHDLLIQEHEEEPERDRYTLLVVSETQSEKIRLHYRTFMEAVAATYRGGVPLRTVPLSVVMVQEPFTMVVSSSHLRELLRNVPLVEGTRSSGYWAISMGIM